MRRYIVGMDGYFIITPSEDGVRVTGPHSVADVTKQITPNEEGETAFGSDPDYLATLPDLNYGPENAVVIIRGSIVVPVERGGKVELPDATR